MKKNTLEKLELIGAIIGFFGVIYVGINQLEDSKRFDLDMELFNKGSALQDEYDVVWNSYYNGNMTKEQYISELEKLIPRFRQHLSEMDSHLWIEDAILDRKMISETLESMKEEVQYSEVHAKLKEDM